MYVHHQKENTGELTLIEKRINNCNNNNKKITNKKDVHRDNRSIEWGKISIDIC